MASPYRDLTVVRKLKLKVLGKMPALRIGIDSYIDSCIDSCFDRSRPTAYMNGNGLGR